MNNNNNDVTKKYGLFTAITMIVGICIGWVYSLKVIMF